MMNPSPGPLCNGTETGDPPLTPTPLQEQGVMGSTEFVEDYRALLSEKAVAYINVDCPVTGWSHTWITAYHTTVRTVFN